MHLWNIWSLSFYRERIFIKIHQFWSNRFISFVRKNNVLSIMCLHFWKMLNIEHRAVIKFFTRKGLNAIEVSKELENAYKDSAPSYRTVANWVAVFNNPEHGFEDASRMGRRSSTITTQENIEAVQRIVMRHRQISVRRLAEELVIIHEIIDNQLDMKKVYTRWILKLLTQIQRANHVDCCQELLQDSEVNPDNFFYSIVTRRWLLDSPLRSSEAAGSQDLKEVRWTNTNSTPPRKFSWKDYDDHFLR